MPAEMLKTNVVFRKYSPLLLLLLLRLFFSDGPTKTEAEEDEDICLIRRSSPARSRAADARRPRGLVVVLLFFSGHPHNFR